MMALAVIAQVPQQLFQRSGFAVDVAHDIEWAGGKGLDKAHGQTMAAKLGSRTEVGWMPERQAGCR
ncbi:hypothetical protein GCM10010975_28580 [Comamonas phosphati]|nr:hypothetical protein GCM10010975_28580 [Comamonas phosphati]